MTTEKGIYYPTDYSDVADIPADMKEMAESIDDALTSSDGEIEGIKEEQLIQNTQINNNKTDIEAIKTEQTEQNTDIQANTDNITALLEKIDYIEGLIPTGEASGESLTLSNTARYPFKEFNVGGNTKQATAILPDEYQQVDYIESSGTQYIDTNYTPIAGDEFEFKNVTLTGDGCIFYAGTGDYQFGYLRLQDISYYKYFTNGGVSGFLNIVFNKSNVNIKNNGDMYIDGVRKIWDTTGSSITGEVNTTLNLFRRVNGTNYMSGTIGEIIIENNGVKKRDFIPCYRKSDNVVGLYDLVNNVFYTNAGTGAFTYGSAVTIPNPSYPQEIENVSGEVEVKVANSFANYEYVTENTKNWTTNATIFQYDKINSNKMLAIVYTDYTEATGPSLTLRGLIGGSYSGNSKELTKQKINNKWCFYGYLTPTATETKYWITNGSSNINNLHSKLYVYDASEFEISDEDLLKFMANPVDVHEEQTATLHLPEGMEMCKIGTYQDSFVYQGGKWYKNKKINKVVLNGTEDWRFNSNYEGRYRYTLTIDDVINYSVNTGTDISAISNRFLGVQTAQWSDTTNSIAVISNKRILIATNLTTLTDFKALLQEKNATVYYVLDTPVLEEITDPTLISDLESLKNLYSYKGTTHISSNTGAIFEVVYRKELESIANS